MAGAILASTIAGVATVNAAVPGPSGTFASAFTVQNLSSSTATCVYQFYDQAGALKHTSASFNLPVGGSSNTYVPSIGGLAAGQYAGVISCDQQVAAVVNHSANAGTNSGAAYDGVDSTKVANTWYAPNAFNNYYGFSTNYVVQNTTGSAVNVTVQIFAVGNPNAVATQSSTIQPNGYANFEQHGLSGLSANTAYSAKITANGNIAVEANTYGLGSNAGQLYSYTPFTSGSNTAYAPLTMNNYYGYNTSVNAQNVGNAAANITITYGNGQTRTINNVAPGGLAEFLQFLSSSGVSNGDKQPAKITSDQPIVVLVNQSTRAELRKNRAASYTGLSNGSSTVRLPTVHRRYYGFSSSVNCQNIGTSAATISIAYSGSSVTSVSGSIPAGGLFEVVVPFQTSLPDGYNGSATATSSQPLVCIANEDIIEGAASNANADTLYSYEGVGQ
jgi:hypothetical protein